MSGFGRALAGLGAGAAGLASRYIDEELAQQRAQALSDIQFANAKRTEQWQQSDEVQTPRLMNQRKALEMQNQVTLQGKESEASSPTLRQARVDNEVAMLEGTTPARIAAENALVEGTAGTKLDAERTRRLVLDPMDVKKAGGMADAQWHARDKYDQRLDGRSGKGPKMSEAGKLQLQDVNKQDEALQKAINDGIAGGTLKQDPSDPAWQHFSKQKQGLQVQKLRIYAREGLVSGSEDAANLIAAGATREDLINSSKQAKLIGGSYTADFEEAIKESIGKQPTAPPAAAPPAAPPRTLMGVRRQSLEQAPAGSPQAKWDSRQQELRNQIEEKSTRALADFDADVQQLEPLELLRKYSDASSRSSLDLPRLARLKQIERTIR